MMKRVFALLICATLLLTSFAGCSFRDYGEEGQSITVYLTDNVYDLDPAHAYKNDALASVVGLMFDTLFVLDEDGDISPSLVKKYWTEENENAGEYTMYLRLNETNWSDNIALTADDVVFAWQRLLEPDATFEAACLLYDVKNARAVKKGCLEDGSTVTIDDVGVSALETDLVEVKFEHEMTDEDYDRFLLNLTSVALAPLRDDVVDKKANPLTGRNEDWAKKGTTMVCSGPFKLTTIKWFADSNDANGVPQQISDFVLERNPYYYRDSTEDSLFKSVAPQRICVDCSLTDEQIKTAYDAGVILYIGDIPMSLRTDSSISKAVEVADYSLATQSIYLNQSVEPFNKKEVRQALSMVIDRAALANAVVYAEAATGFIPTGVYDNHKGDQSFRDACTSTYTTLATNVEEAKSLLSEAGIKGSKYSFTLTCPAYDEVQCFVAEEIAKVWKEELGFKVTVEKVETISNDDYYNMTANRPVDICDDPYAERLENGEFEAIIFDACAYAPDAYGLLAPFAHGFSGRAVDLSVSDDVELPAHVTGFNNQAYNEKIEAIMAESDPAARARLYREAEQLLMDEMPVIPVLFNLEASVKNDKLTSVDETYYVKAVFTDAYINGYEEYLDAGFNFLSADRNFANLKFHQSKNCGYAVKPIPEKQEGRQWESWLKKYDEAWNVFIQANSVYSHFVEEAAAALEAAETEAAA